MTVSFRRKFKLVASFLALWSGSVLASPTSVNPAPMSLEVPSLLIDSYFTGAFAALHVTGLAPMESLASLPSFVALEPISAHLLADSDWRDGHHAKTLPVRVFGVEVEWPVSADQASWPAALVRGSATEQVDEWKHEELVLRVIEGGVVYLPAADAAPGGWDADFVIEHSAVLPEASSLALLCVGCVIGVVPVLGRVRRQN